MKKWLIKQRLLIIGSILGAVGGYMYWKYVGCLNGSCAITGSALNSTLYFAFLGAVMLSFFKNTKKKGESGR